MRTGQVSFGGTLKEVNLAYVPEAKVDNYVIVHVGFAISVLNEEEAHRVFDTLNQLNNLDNLEGDLS
jgi:hydrogenase expression/formation protein HypC